MFHRIVLLIAIIHSLVLASSLQFSLLPHIYKLDWQKSFISTYICTYLPPPMAVDCGVAALSEKSCLIYFRKRTRCKLKINKTCLHYYVPSGRHHIRWPQSTLVLASAPNIPLAIDGVLSALQQVNEKSRISFFFNYDFKIKIFKTKCCTEIWIFSHSQQPSPRHHLSILHRVEAVVKQMQKWNQLPLKCNNKMRRCFLVAKNKKRIRK